MIDAKSNKVIIKSGQKPNFLQAKKLHSEGLKEILVSSEYLRGKFLHKKLNILEDEFKIGTELNETIIEKIIENNINTIIISKTNSINLFPDKN